MSVVCYVSFNPCESSQIALLLAQISVPPICGYAGN